MPPGRIFRYIFGQAALATGLVAVSLGLAIWLTQSLRFVDWIVNRGLPISTFLTIAALTMPLFLSAIIPISCFAAVLFTYNKLAGDSELVVMRASGVGPARLMAPAISLAVIVAGIGWLLNLYLLPTAYGQFKDLQWQIRNSFASILIQEGVFTPIDDRMVIFVREQSSAGELLGLMVHDSREPDRTITLVAERGALVSSAEGPRVVMVNGNRQELDTRDGRISFLFFDRYTITLDAAANAAVGIRQRDATERFLWELLDPADPVDTRTRGVFRAEGHSRLANPLYTIVFTVIALAALLGGSFSRRGQSLRMVGAVAAVVALQALAIGLTNLAGRNAGLIPLLYLVPVLATAVALGAVAAPPGWFEHRFGRPNSPLAPENAPPITKP
ncbi:MAG: LPS export ABC transporter permease LptF [Alphaproteobacteria bacterium]|nr:LPS export ABC transporter permease LptF [Alphaproteobacteria bacterium]TAD90884.1 MAG: LPS export ABC transporter permease LptF [Alphaproteobacteria bacterium]